MSYGVARGKEGCKWELRLPISWPWGGEIFLDPVSGPNVIMQVRISGRRRSVPGLSLWLADVVILGFWLQNCETVHLFVLATQPEVLCYGGHSKQIQASNLNVCIRFQELVFIPAKMLTALNPKPYTKRWAFSSLSCLWLRFKIKDPTSVGCVHSAQAKKNM